MMVGPVPPPTPRLRWTAPVELKGVLEILQQRPLARTAARDGL